MTDKPIDPQRDYAGKRLALYFRLKNLPEMPTELRSAESVEIARLEKELIEDARYEQLRLRAESDTLRPDESALVRARHKKCYFPLCLCKHGCQFLTP